MKLNNCTKICNSFGDVAKNSNIGVHLPALWLAAIATEESQHSQ